MNPSARIGLPLPLTQLLPSSPAPVSSPASIFSNSGEPPPARPRPTAPTTASSPKPTDHHPHCLAYLPPSAGPFYTARVGEESGGELARTLATAAVIVVFVSSGGGGGGGSLPRRRIPPPDPAAAAARGEGGRSSPVWYPSRQHCLLLLQRGRGGRGSAGSRGERESGLASCGEGVGRRRGHREVSWGVSQGVARSRGRMTVTK